MKRLRLRGSEEPIIATIERGTGIIDEHARQAEAEGAAGASPLADLYAQHAPAITRFAFLLTGDRWAAEDLAQEAFVRVAGRLRAVHAPEAFRTYLRRIVINLATSRARRKRLERAHLERESRLPQQTEMPDVELRDQLRRALRRLPVRQRAALILRYFEDLPERQAAEGLDCSVPAARSLVHRAMQTLRMEIGEER